MPGTRASDGAARLDERMNQGEEVERGMQRDQPERALLASQKPTTLGPPPPVPLEGGTDPARVDDHKARADVRVAERTVNAHAALDEVDLRLAGVPVALPNAPTLEIALPDIASLGGPAAPTADPPPTDDRASGRESSGSRDPALQEFEEAHLATMDADYQEHRRTYERELEDIHTSSAQELGTMEAAFQAQHQAVVSGMDERVTAVKRDTRARSDAAAARYQAQASSLQAETHGQVDAEMTSGTERMASIRRSAEADAVARKTQREQQAVATMESGRAQAAATLAEVGLPMEGGYEASAVRATVMRQSDSGSGLLEPDVDEQALEQRRQAAIAAAQTSVNAAMAAATQELTALRNELTAILNEAESMTEAELQEIVNRIYERLTVVQAVLDACPQCDCAADVPASLAPG